MGIYEDRQICTKTGFRPIKLQESQPCLHTNRTLYNNNIYLLTSYLVYTEKYQSHIVWTGRNEYKMNTKHMCHATKHLSHDKNVELLNHGTCCMT